MRTQFLTSLLIRGKSRVLNTESRLSRHRSRICQICCSVERQTTRSRRSTNTVPARPGGFKTQFRTSIKDRPVPMQTVSAAVTLLARKTSSEGTWQRGRRLRGLSFRFNRTMRSFRLASRIPIPLSRFNFFRSLVVFAFLSILGGITI